MAGKKIKIIHVPRRFVREIWGGTETVIIETSRELEKAGYKPQVFTSKALCNTPSEIVYNIPVRRFSYIYARLGLTATSRRLLDRRGGNILSFPFFFALLRCKNIKVVHLHTGGRLGTFVRLISKLRNFPYVLSIHGGMLEMPQKQHEELIAPLRGSFNWGKIFDLMLGTSRVEKDAAAIICVSRREQELLAEKYPDKKIIYLENGVDIAHFEAGNGDEFRKQYGLNNEKLILCVASFNPQKNQVFLIGVLKRIIQRYPDCKLVLIGTIYDQHYYEKLLTEAQNENLRDSLLIIPDLPFDSNTLINAYAACDVFVLPSLYEPFGIVVLEAWAAEKAIACSGVGGLKYFVCDSENGLIFDPNSVENAADKVLQLLDDKGLAARLAAAGKQTAKVYSWEKISEKLINLYEEL
ncbi:MAG: glycosyltransferase family 4 protein [Victivallaceae bacterium]|nr:glycosyltransferase family 4 protein [Victivallaceae bacterium]